MGEKFPKWAYAILVNVPYFGIKNPKTFIPYKNCLNTLTTLK